MTLRKILAGAAVAGAVLASGAGFVDAAKDSAPGQVIKTECGASYGQIVSSFTTDGGFNQGQHAKNAELKPGAKSFVETEGSLGIHGCD